MALTQQKKENIRWVFEFALDIISLGIIPLIQAIKKRRAERKESKLNDSN